MALTMPLLFLFDRSEAQNTKLTGDIIYSVLRPQEITSNQLTGKVAICGLVKQITITGKVFDENNNPLAYATIMQKETKHGTVSDSLGNFSIDMNSADSIVTLVASYVGYEKIEQKININSDTLNMTINLKPVVAGEVVVVGEVFKYETSRRLKCLSENFNFSKNRHINQKSAWQF